VNTSGNEAAQCLVLFDVDGTLLTPGPVPRLALAEALSRYLGLPVELSFHEVAGFTDPTIIQNALARYGNHRQVSPAAVEAIIGDYLALVTERLPDSDAVQVFPGAKELVMACRNEGWTTALLTGNVEQGARLKLDRTGLWELFAFGVFGNDGNSREDLPWLARERAWEVLSVAFSAKHIILVGDTPNDARIARLNAIRSLIVCRRGEPEWRAAIKAESPTWLVDDLEDIPVLIQLMKG
jgi:phosphoglycolate phosphatase-like HAD superfamily hydrolase